MARIIAIANQKGGVTKTTTTFNLATALASKGCKVLMVDMDSQASLTISAGIEPLEIPNTIVDILDKKQTKPTQDCIYPITHIENLSIITSIIDLAVLEMEMLSRSSREKILSRALEPIQNDYDFIFIDCPPQLSILTINALSAADQVIVPVKTDYLAYRGLTQLNNTIKEIKDLINPNLEVAGVIAALYEMQVTEDREILEELKNQYKVIGVIKKTAAAKKGIYDGLPVVLQFKNKEIAQEYIKIADMIRLNHYKGVLEV